MAHTKDPVIHGEPVRDWAHCCRCDGLVERDADGWYHDATDPDYVQWPYYHAPEPDFIDRWN